MARTRQPQGPVRIIPRYADATVAINFAQLRNQGTIGTCQPILTGGATQRPNVGGIGAGPPDANGGYIALGTTAATQLNTQSGVICWVPTTTSAVAALFNSSFTAGANGFAINQLANGTVELSKHNTAAIVTTTNAANNNAVNTLAWSYTTAGTATVVLNGVVTSANSAQSLTHGDAVLGKYRSGDNAFCIAVLFNLFVLWPKTRSATELSYLCENPWSVFSSPRRIWIQLGVAASGDTSLIIPDISQTQSLDSLLLTTQSAIVIQDTAQTHALENIVLSTAASTNLIVNDTSQTHTVDAPLLTSASLLGLADTSQSHTLDNTILTSNTGVVVADTSQVHTLDNLDLDSGLILTIDGINHTHSVEATGTLVTTSVLQIADVAHGQQTDSIDLNAQWFITVNDSNHSHTVEVPTLTLPGTGTGATVDEIADEIMLRLNATTIPVDVQKINSVEVFGTGTNIDPWR